MQQAFSAIAAFVASSVIFMLFSVITHHRDDTSWAMIAFYIGAMIAGAASALMVVALARLRSEERQLDPRLMLGALRRRLHDSRVGVVELGPTLDVRRCDGRARRLLGLAERWPPQQQLNTEDADPLRASLARAAMLAIDEGSSAFVLARPGARLGVFGVRLEGVREAVMLLLVPLEREEESAPAEAPPRTALETPQGSLIPSLPRIAPLDPTGAAASGRAGVEAVAHVSHELRTPLVSIRGYAELLDRGGLGPLNPRQERAVETMLRNLDRLLTMVDSLLDLSRLSHAAQEQLKPDRFDLVGLTRDVVEMLQPRSDEARVSLKLRRQGADECAALTVSADRIKLHQVLTNLLGNALKFTDPGGRVRIYVREATLEDTQRVEELLGRARVDQLRLSGEWPLVRRRGRWVLLRVTDTGCGIPEEALGQIFDRFYTDSGDRAERAGTGLGLAITDQIVRLHDGVIEVASELGAGTIFSVWLPIGEQVELLAPPPANVTALPVRSAGRGQVLLVDDEPDVAEFGRFVLEQEGYNVRVAASASHLWAALEGAPLPEVLLLDYTLPDASGQEVIAQLRRDDRLGSIVIGVVSARTDDAVRQSCIEAGAWGFLPKPYGIDDLLEFVEGAQRVARNPGAAGRVAER